MILVLKLVISEIFFSQYEAYTPGLSWPTCNGEHGRWIDNGDRPDEFSFPG